MGPPPAVAAAFAASAHSVFTPPQSSPPSQATTSAAAAGPAVASASASASSITSPTPSSSALSSSVSPRPKSAIQKKKNRCFSRECRTKLSMVEQQTNKCLCGYTFCVKHRHVEDHDCTADHKSPGKKRLASANQRVVHDKMNGNRI